MRVLNYALMYTKIVYFLHVHRTYTGGRIGSSGGSAHHGQGGDGSKEEELHVVVAVCYADVDSSG